MGTLIHWHEGLFLQPHHLQILQRSFIEQAVSDRRLGLAYPYGVIEMVWSEDALRKGVVKFDRLRAVMRSGLEVDCPASAHLPSLNIEAALARRNSLLISLGVPIYQPKRANSFKINQALDSRNKLLFHPTEGMFPDENTGESVKPLLLRKVNARLLLDGDDDSDMEKIPLLRIQKETTPSGDLPRTDTEYAPPCILLSASPMIQNLVRETAELVMVTRNVTANSLRKGFNPQNMPPQQLRQMMRLQTLNRFAGTLAALAQAPAVPMFTIYLQLSELLGELAAVHPDRDPFEDTPYEHENPYPPIRLICDKIRRNLTDQEPDSFQRVDFKESGQGLQASLQAESIERASAVFLAVRTRMDSRALADYVTAPEKFKLLAPSQSRFAINGVPVQEERHPPIELPTEIGLNYFRVIVSSSTSPAAKARWEEIRKERRATVVWNRDAFNLSDAAFALYLTIPNMRSSE